MTTTLSSINCLPLTSAIFSLQKETNEPKSRFTSRSSSYFVISCQQSMGGSADQQATTSLQKILSGRRYPLLFSKNLHNGVSMRSLLDQIVAEMLRSSRVHILWTFVESQHHHHTTTTRLLPTFAILPHCKQIHDMLKHALIFIPELFDEDRASKLRKAARDSTLCKGMVTLIFKGTIVTCSCCYSCTLKLSNIINYSW